jgi:alkaline phosphatase D
VLNRRQVLTGAAAVAGAAVLPATLADSAAAGAGRVVPTGSVSAVFPLGVASGDPLPDGVILWTHLAAPSGGRPTGPVRVGWQVAHDEAFRAVARSGSTVATSELDHAVHVDVRGLLPGRGYFYRFHAAGEISPVGRTRTAPAPLADIDRLRFAIANCQDFQNGYWPAFLGLADEDLDVVLHLGDYIYETDPGSRFADRNHTVPQTPGLNQLVTLDDYRARYAQYQSDPALQAAHAVAPWIVTWDDHEVENNYANLTDQAEDTGAAAQTPEQFAAQRAAAYQAYYEHLPIRARFTPGSVDLRIFRRFDFGRLLRLNVLDTRQYRTDQPGGYPQDFGPESAGTSNAAGTLTGADQERWLTEGLTGSPARWNVLAQQVMMGRLRLPNPVAAPPAVLVNLDQWDGYAPQRARLLRGIADAGVTNPVVLSGDIHSTWFNELRVDFDRPETAPVAVEFVATSISSAFPDGYDAVLRAVNPVWNPHVRYFDGVRHGYLRCEVDRGLWRTEARTVETIAERQSPMSTTASYVVHAGASTLTTE